MKTWLITGATRGLGKELVISALTAGSNVVATGRRVEDLRSAFGEETAQLAFQALDVTDKGQAQRAVDAAQAQFGGLDVLVNNAGYGHLSVLEDLTAADVEAQFATNVYGMFNLCWAALPVMRAAGRGHIFNISSIAGIRGGAAGSLYCASKHAVEGFSEALAFEVGPFGIKTTIVVPGFFRTDFFSDASMRYGSNPIADYAAVRAEQHAFRTAHHRQQPGDPAKLAAVIVGLADAASPPLRFAAGSDAVDAIQTKINSLQQELDAWKSLSASTDFA